MKLRCYRTEALSNQYIDIINFLSGYSNNSYTHPVLVENVGFVAHTKKKQIKTETLILLIQSSYTFLMWRNQSSRLEHTAFV